MRRLNLLVASVLAELVAEPRLAEQLVLVSAARLVETLAGLAETVEELELAVQPALSPKSEHLRHQQYPEAPPPTCLKPPLFEPGKKLWEARFGLEPWPQKESS